MDNTKLVDSLKLPLKSYNDLRIAFNHMLTNDLEDYLNHFIAPFPGDWPMQFSMRQQLVYNNSSVSLPDACKIVVPLIGPLHISLNSRECVLLNFHNIFSDIYSFLFGVKAKLAKKPKPWRLSIFLEVIYGGWIMMMIFHRRHYDKALLIVVSIFKYWQENTHQMYKIIQQFLVPLDEYPVENFHSVL